MWMEPKAVGRTLTSVTPGSDATDWALACGGDGAAFRRLFVRHRERLYRHGMRLLGHTAEADDLVAVVFFEAWRNRDRVRVVDGSILPWLLVTGTNTARNLHRSSRRYRAMLDRLPTAERSPDPADLVIDTVATNALRHLSKNDRQVIILCVIEGFSEREAAETLGVPVGTIKSRLSRARARLAALVVQPPMTFTVQLEGPAQ